MGLKNAICGMTGLLCDQYKNTSGTGPANKVAEEKAQLTQQQAEPVKTATDFTAGYAHEKMLNTRAAQMKALGID